VLKTDRLDELKEKLIQKMEFDKSGRLFRKFDRIKFWFNCKRGDLIEKLDREKIKEEMEEILDAFEEFHYVILQREVTATPKEPAKAEEKKGSEGPSYKKIPSSNAEMNGDEEKKNENI
jgi:hypothetical protein